MEYSVVIPLYNEEAFLEKLQKRLDLIMGRLVCEYEVIYIDDGSTDNSPAVLHSMKGRYPRMRVISFAKNNGQSAALQAGFSAAKGRWIITLDADLQNPPEEISDLLRFKDEFDFITGVRQKRRDSVIKRMSTKVGRFFLWLILKDTTRDPGCSLKLFRREVASATPPLRNFHRYFTFLARTSGFLVKEVNVRHRPRIFGKSKYGTLSRAREGIVDIWRVRRIKKSLLLRAGNERARCATL